MLDRLQAALKAGRFGSSDFDLNPDVVMQPDRKLRAAAVLVAVIDRPSGMSVILTKRSSRLKHHPGQIAFPGGKVDDTDKDVVAAALREAKEEIGLPPDAVQVLGELGPHETVTNFQVVPIVGHVTAPFKPIAEPGEVDEVFEVPLRDVTDPARFSVQSRLWQGRRRYYDTVPHGPYYIWGATARILRGLGERMT